MNKNLVIFSGSRNQIDDNKLNSILKEIGGKIDNSIYDVWYGGGKSGIMGIIPQEFYNKKGKVFSVNIEQFLEASENIGEQIVLNSYCERQKTLIETGDIFLCLPGGLGTISELFDVLVNITYSNKDSLILLYSYNDFYKEIITFLFQNINSGYISEEVIDNLRIFYDHEELIKFLNNPF